MISIVLPLITAPYVSRRLGVVGIGNISFTQAIFVYFNLLAAMGTGTYAQRLIASKQDNPISLDAAFWEIVVLKGFLTIIAAICYSIYIGLFGGKFKLLFCVQFVDLMVNAVDIAWLFQGIEDFRKTVSRQIIIRIIGAISVFLFVRQEGDEYKYLLCHSIPMIIGYASMWLDIKSVGIVIVKKDIHPFSHLYGVIALFVPYIAVLLFSYVDRIMIGGMTKNIAEVGYYEQGNKFVAVSITFITSLTTVLLPKIASLYQSNNLKVLQDYIVRAVKFVLCFGCLLTIGLCMVGENLVPWYFGDEFLPSLPIMRVLSFLIVLKGLNSIIGSGYLIATYKQSKYTVAIYSSTILNIILNAILIPTHNAIGAALASVISEIFLFCFLLHYSKKVLFSRSILSVKNYLISAIITFCLLHPVIKQLPYSFIYTVLATAMTIVMYFSILFFFKDEFFMNQLVTLLKSWKNKISEF